ASPPSARIASAVSASPSSRRPQPTVTAPRRASSRAVARPMPVPAPETAQTWPASRPGAKIREGAGSPIAAATIAAVPAPCRRYADRSVKVHAEPKPLTEPLAGGRQGATVVVEPLKAGEVQIPLQFLERSGGRLEHLRALGMGTARSQWPWVPCPAFLIHHPSAG